MQKDSNYYNSSLEITKEFIQSVTMIDDKASFSEGGEGSSEYFDAGQVTKKFAEDGKICSVYKFTEENDIDKIVKISQKSDVTILDWKMALFNSGQPNDTEDDLEEDDKASKGHYTIEILKRVVSSQYNKLKLFVIYTDEVEFNRIIDEIKKSFVDIGLEIQNESHYSFHCNSNKVTIFGKEALKAKATHVKEILERSFDYAELPEAVYVEFANFTHGVVSNIFFKSITSIRANTYFLLDTFHRDIDAAFITHKGLLPTPNDAHEHIIELIGSEIKSVIGGALDEVITNSLIENFVDSLDESHFLEYKDENNKNIKFSKEKFKSFLIGNKYQFVAPKKTLPDDLTKSIIQARDSSLDQQQLKDTAHQSNIKFAKLTMLKNRYLKFNKPILTLGVILKGTSISGEDEYWICIQPKCDSLRIPENENNYIGRSFSFLSLSKIDNGEIVYDTKTRFKVEYSIKKSRQFMFRPTINNMVFVRGEDSEKWFFLDSFGRRFEYVCELKNDFAQSIANTFASQISRVAMNHSEWLRLNVNK